MAEEAPATAVQEEMGTAATAPESEATDAETAETAETAAKTTEEASVVSETVEESECEEGTAKESESSEMGALVSAATVERIRELYDAAKTKLAHSLLLELERALESVTDSEEEAAVETKRAMEEAALLLFHVRYEAEGVAAFLEELEHGEGWELAREGEECATHFKQVPGSPTMLIKLQGLVRAPAFAVLACINEIDLYHTWIPTMTASDILLHLSAYKKMVHLQVQAPSPISWVVSPREMVLYGYGADLMEENKLIAMAQTPSPEALAMLQRRAQFTPPPPRPGVVRMDCKLAGMLFEPLGPKTTRVSVLTNVDPMMDMPYWVINKGTKQFAHMIMTFLRKQSCNLNAEYRRRIDESGTLYDNIRSRLAGEAAEVPPPETTEEPQESRRPLVPQSAPALLHVQ